jgi:hypothetical protein
MSGQGHRPCETQEALHRHKTEDLITYVERAVAPYGLHWSRNRDMGDYSLSAEGGGCAKGARRQAGRQASKRRTQGGAGPQEPRDENLEKQSPQGNATKRAQKPEDKQGRGEGVEGKPSRVLKSKPGYTKSIRLMWVAARIPAEDGSGVGLPYEDAQGLPVAA